LAQPGARFTEAGIRNRTGRWLSAPFLAGPIRYRLQFRDGHWRLQFGFEPAAYRRLLTHRLGRTGLTA
jgi:hypothetical protein